MVLRWSCLVVLALISSSTLFAKTTNSIQFKKQKIQISQNKKIKTILVEVAETSEQHAYGLMFREKLKPDEGMLFVFEDEQVRSFWMKNTLIDLDIAYFDENKKIIDIQQMKAAKSIMQTDLPSYPSRAPAMYALEMPQGWFKKNQFTDGAIFKFLTGPLSNKK